MPTAEGVGVNGGGLEGDISVFRFLFFGVTGGTGGGGISVEVDVLLFVEAAPMDVEVPLTSCFAALVFRFLLDAVPVVPFVCGTD